MEWWMASEDRRKGRPDSRETETKQERRKGDRRRDARVPVNIWVEEYKGQVRVLRGRFPVLRLDAVSSD